MIPWRKVSEAFPDLGRGILDGRPGVDLQRLTRIHQIVCPKPTIDGKYDWSPRHAIRPNASY